MAADKLLVMKAVTAERARREAMAAQKAECEQDLLEFIRTFWRVLEPETELIHGWPLDQLTELLMAVVDGHMTRLIINLPPGFSKSLVLNVFFPAWVWGPCNRPHTRFLSASYSASLTERDNGKLVRLVTDADYVRWWGSIFRLTKDGVGKVENDRTGFKLATSVGGTVTGERADYVCFPNHTLILSDRGWLPIGEIVDGRLPVRICGFQDGRSVWQDIEEYERREWADFIVVVFEGGSFTVTPEHPIFVVGAGWVTAGEIRPGDALVWVGNDHPLPVVLEGDTAQAPPEKDILQPDLPVRREARDGRSEQFQPVSDLRDVGLSDAGIPREAGPARGMATKIVISVGREAGLRRVYNLNVAPAHNYFAEGVLVHNCVDDGNNPATVESDTVRESTNRWVREVMPTRLNDPKRSIIINLQQRTHAEDVTGILAEHGSGYHWWVLPIEYDPLRDTPTAIRWDENGDPIQFLEDPRGRTPKVYDEDGNWISGGEKLEGEFIDERGALKIRHGSPLAQADGELAWPERYPLEEIQKLKTILGPYAYAGQFLQMPSARGGGIIRRDWWQVWADDKFPDLGTVIGVLDTAIKEAEQNDFNAFQSWGAFADSRREGAPAMMLTTAWKGRMSLAELVARTYESCWEQKVDYLLIEDKARGHDVAAEMQRQYVEVPWQTILIPANGRGSFSGDKVARLTAVSPLFSGDVRKDHNGIDVWSGGMIYAPDKDWADQVIDEVSQFPRGAHDDHCFVAGTMIATARGSVAIEDVKRGDRVITPMGWAAVLAAFQTGVEPVITRAGVTGTASHPMFSLSRPYQPLYEIKQAEIGKLSLCGLIRTLLLSGSSSRASLIAGWGEGASTISPRQRRIVSALEPKDCTLQSGKAPTDSVYRRAMRSIIGTATLSTAILTIWSAYRLMCIDAFRKRALAAIRFSPISTNSGCLLRHGIGRMRAALGIATTPSTGPCDARRLSASNAEANSRPATPMQCSVAVGAPRGGDTRSIARNQKQGHAFGAGEPSSRRGQLQSIAERLAPKQPPTSSEGSAVPVFNLSVEWPHCYYANGVLAHNCDCVSMALSWVRRHGVVLRKVEHDRRELEKKRYRRPPSLPYSIRGG